MRKFLSILIILQFSFSFAQEPLTPCQLEQINATGLIGEFIPQECNRGCGYGMRDEIYNITQQPGDKGYKCAHKEGKIIRKKKIGVIGKINGT